MEKGEHDRRPTYKSRDADFEPPLGYGEDNEPLDESTYAKYEGEYHDEYHFDAPERDLYDYGPHEYAVERLPSAHSPHQHHPEEHGYPDVPHAKAPSKADFKDVGSLQAEERGPSQPKIEDRLTPAKTEHGSADFTP